MSDQVVKRYVSTRLLPDASTWNVSGAAHTYVHISDYAALEAELATVKKVAYGNMELLDENRNLQAELAKLRAGQEPVAFKKPSLLMDCNVRYSTSTTPQPSAGVVTDAARDVLAERQRRAERNRKQERNQ